MYSRLFVFAFLEPPNVGEIGYDPYAYHVTFLNSVTVPSSIVNEVKASFEVVSSSVEPIEVKVGKQIFLGKDYDIPAVEVEDVLDGVLLRTHFVFLEMVEKYCEAVLTYPEYTGSNFKPHMSWYLEGNKGKKIRLNVLSLVEHRLDSGLNVDSMHNLKNVTLLHKG